MIDQNGTVKEGGETKAQVQLITNDEGRRAQLYGTNGIFLCECPFEGDDDKGFEIGMALYYGYKAAWVNADISFTKAINRAILQKHPLEV